MNDEEDFPQTPDSHTSDTQDTRDFTSISDLSKQQITSTSGSSLTSAPVIDSETEDLESIESSIANHRTHTQSTSESNAIPALDNSAIMVAPPELINSVSEFEQNQNATPDALSTIREYSEQLGNIKTNVPAGFPFSLTITGELTRDEQDKLLDVLSRTKMGISGVDLEIQFTGNRILIPRISEYAGVLLVQALRDTKAVLRLAPSDEVYSSEATLTSRDEKLASSETQKQNSSLRTQSAHPAETLPITAGNSLPNSEELSVIDVLTASAALKTTLVEAESSSEYQETLEALQRELRYKAYYKHAFAILDFSAQLTTLHLPSEYRLTVSGTAVRKRFDTESVTS